MKMLYTLLTACFLTLPSFAQNDLFDRAQSAYDDGRYGEAASLYERMLSNGVDNAEVHYNLANACFKNHELPNAVLHYRRAAYDLPRDPDIAANLHFALNAAGAIEPTPSFIERSLSTLSKNEWIVLGTGSYALLTLLLLLLLFMKRQRRMLFRLIALPTLLLALAYFGWRHWHLLTIYPEWVVTQTEATTRFSPIEGSTAHFKLPHGALVRQSSMDSKGWVEVEYDGKQGWIKQEFIRRVSP